MKKLFLVLSLSLLLIIAACGGNSVNTEPTVNNNSAATDAAVTDSTATDAPAASPEGSASEQPKAEQQRIVALSIVHTSNLLALGIKPYGAVTQAGKNFLPHVADMLEGTLNMGSSQEPNLEAVVDAAPDLIIAQDELFKDGTTEIEKIAPVYSLPAFGELTWREQLLKLGEELDRVAEAEAFLTQYDEKLAQIKETVKQAVGEETVMVLRVMPKEIRLYGLDRSYGSLLYEDLGLNPVPGLENPGEGPQAISREVLPQYDADHILLEVSSNDDSQQLYKELQESAIWNNMKAVKNGNVHMIEQQPWLDYSAMGMMKSLELADTLFVSER